jgi:lysophospholipase L1-like esterase
MNKDFKYYKLTPFKWFILENFPFIEADFDALTNYELFCKIGKEMNKIIEATNLSGEQVEALTEFVNNFFDNLNVQEEINNKLDEMAQDGTLAEIINQEIFTELNNKINSIDNELHNEKIVMYGDSYARGSLGGGQTTTSWCTRVARLMGKENDYYSDGLSGGAFYNGTLNNGFNSFINTIPSNDKLLVKKVIIGAGANDFVLNYASNISNNIAEMITIIKNNFPNAKIYFCFIGYKNIMDSTFASVRNGLLNNVIAAYQTCQNYGALFAGNIGYILHDSTLISAEDGTHPTEAGYVYLSEAIYNFVEAGKSFIRPFSRPVAITPLNENVTINQNNHVFMCDEITTWNSPEFQLTFETAVNTTNVGLIEFGSFDNPSFVRPNSTTTLIARGTFLVTFDDNTQDNIEASLRIGSAGQAYLVFNKTYSGIKSLRSRCLIGSIPTVTM